MNEVNELRNLAIAMEQMVDLFKAQNHILNEILKYLKDESKNEVPNLWV